MSEQTTTRLAATVLLVRDGPDGLEVFMVVRHHEIDFASGAMVFPGGSVDAADSDPRVRALSDGVDGLDDAALSVRVAAAREAFEECGVLYARENGSDALIDGARAQALGARYREALEQGEVSMADVAEREGLRLALGELEHFAHWVTPANMPKRFDTHFFVSAAPADHELRHDGTESVDSIWIRPADACAAADAGERTIIFPTRLNVEKLGQSPTVEAALGAARSAPVVCVRPEVEKTENGRILHIPAEAGYGGSEFVVGGQAGQRAEIQRRG
ncbi:MAG: NUDIX hydrolase [Pseudomonadota bacterium]